MKEMSSLADLQGRLQEINVAAAKVGVDSETIFKDLERSMSDALLKKTDVNLQVAIDRKNCNILLGVAQSGGEIRTYVDPRTGRGIGIGGRTLPMAGGGYTKKGGEWYNNDTGQAADTDENGDPVDENGNRLEDNDGNPTIWTMSDEDIIAVTKVISDGTWWGNMRGAAVKKKLKDNKNALEGLLDELLNP